MTTPALTWRLRDDNVPAPAAHVRAHTPVDASANRSAAARWVAAAVGPAVARARRWVVLVLAVSQLAVTAAVYASGATGFTDTGSDPAITPAGYAFAIWTIPLLACLVYAGYAFGRDHQEPFTVIGWPLAVTMAGFDGWLWCATRGWVWATVAVFAVMLAALAVAVRGWLGYPAAARVGRVIVAATVGVYAGWTTVAVWANLAAALHAGGADLPNEDAAWQLAVLAGAAITAVAGVWWTRAATAYTAVVLWALVAVVVATATATNAGGHTALLIAATVSVVVVTAVAIAARVAVTRRRRASGTPPAGTDPATPATAPQALDELSPPRSSTRTD